MIEHWKLNMIVGFWLKSLDLDPDRYVIKEGFGSVDNWKRVVSHKASFGNPADGIRKRVIGWNRTDGKTEIFTGAVTPDTEGQEGDRFFWSQFEPNVNITINPYGSIFHDKSKFEAFSKAEMDKLFGMLVDPDETIAQYSKDHPKYEHDDRMELYRYHIRHYCDRCIKIEFGASNKVLPRDGLYVGFEGKMDNGKPRDYVFKITKKTRNLIHHLDEYLGMAVYEAEFHGYFTPSEEELDNADFGWVIDEDVITTANNEARLT